MRAAAALLLALGLATPARARAVLEVNSFPGASNLPIWVAQRENLFEARGLEVHLSHASGSVDQFRGVADGRYSVILTAFDNVLAYHDGTGAPGIGAIPDLVAVAQVDSGFLTLVAAPPAARVEDLRGKAMAVDALSTGFSFALKGILGQAGIAPDAVSYVAVGSSDGRWRALREGRASAALLSLPTDLEAEAHGFRPLATAGGVLSGYVANVVAARDGWAAAHPEELGAFLRGWSEGLRWLLAPANRADALGILHAEMPALDTGLLNQVYAVLVDERSGLLRDPAVSERSARTVMALRARFAPPPQALRPASAYLDPRFLRDALAR